MRRSPADPHLLAVARAWCGALPARAARLACVALPACLTVLACAALQAGGVGRSPPGANVASGGWLIQRAITSKVALGAEGYVTIPTDGAAVQTQLDAGIVADLSERRHLLLSAGPSFGAGSRA